MRHWAPEVLALTGTMDYGIPWHRAVYFAQNLVKKCDLGGIRTHALRKSALTENAQWNIAQKPNVLTTRPCRRLALPAVLVVCIRGLYVGLYPHIFHPLLYLDQNILPGSTL